MTEHIVYGREGTLWAVPFDLDRLEVMGDPVPVLEGVGVRSTGAVNFDLSSTGSLVYAVGETESSNIVTLSWVDRDGNEESIPASPRAYDHPRVSPDGTRVAVDVADGANTDIWIWNLAEERLTQLTFDEGLDDFPLWTPDSARVVFRSTRDAGGLFWKAADGTGQVEQLKDGLARPYAWATDGRLIFDQAADVGVLTMEGEGTVEMLLDADFNEAHPALSPDGRWLAYLSDETGQPRIYVKPFPNVDDGLWNVSLGMGRFPVWSPDGRELFYESPTTGMMVAQIETEPTFSSETPEPLFNVSAILGTLGDAIAGRRFDLAPDGDRFIVRIPETTAGTDDASTSGSQIVVVQNWTEELNRLAPIP